MVNDSSTGGYLKQIAPGAANQAQLENLLHDLVAGITGLDNTLVRPRWQPMPANQPDPATDWCAFGIIRQSRTDYPVIRHAPGGPSTLYRIVLLETLASFYGPNCQDYAAQLRDGIYIQQNMESLNAAGLVLYDADELLIVPEQVNAQWINRVDLSIKLNWQVSRSYRILDIESSQGTVKSDTGVASPWDTRN